MVKKVEDIVKSTKDNLNNVLESDDLFYINKTILNNDLVTIHLINNNGQKIKLPLLVDDYYNYGIKKESIFTINEIEELQKKVASTLAYRSAIRRLTIKDYSVHKMKDALKKKFDITDKELEDVIIKLKNNKLLNDEQYTKSRINYLSNSLLSIKAIRQKLVNDGIAKELIDKYLAIDRDNEIDKVQAKANKYLTSIKGKSVNSKKQAIMQKLIYDGFNIEDIKTAIDELDFRKDASLENDLLKLEKEKAYHKYSKKYEGYELKKHMYNYLATKGFSLDSIKEVLNEMEY